MIIDTHLHVGYEKDYVGGSDERRQWWKTMFCNFEKPYGYSTDEALEMTVDDHLRRMDDLGLTA